MKGRDIKYEGIEFHVASCASYGWEKFYKTYRGKFPIDLSEAWKRIVAEAKVYNIPVKTEKEKVEKVEAPAVKKKVSK